jgi:hypothetical protein
VNDWHPVLSGIVGSTAYGLAGPDSDIDRLAFAAAPTVAFHGLHLPIGKAASRVGTNPDVTVHEIGKGVSLLLNANPTVTELLWLDAYETSTDLGQELISMRGLLIGAGAARSAYLGYATSQFQRMKRRGDGTFSSNIRKRTAKHGRHLMRLCTQVRSLWVAGEMSVRVADPDRYHAFGQLLAENPEKGMERAESLLLETATILNTQKTVLRAHPDFDAAEAFLRHVRATYYSPEG